ncbi:DUF6929 family protein [Flavobacterium sp.]|uniref:DUF6929 family protein n=1 Tax=Flavobacterium sp. TaxID=239 RepID=UPI0038FCD632
MASFNIKSAFKINGVSAASGLVLKDNTLYLISDNSTYLYEYSVLEKKLIKIPLIDNAQENIPKKYKLDFEAIALKENKLYIFTSGSKSNREKRLTYNLEIKEIKEKKLSEFYERLKHKSSISDDDLNIEGVCFGPVKWYLFQRGNSENSKNGVFSIDNNDKHSIDFYPFELPKIEGVNSTFTDVILVEDKFYFLAAAENTLSTYNDGEISGSIIGRIDSETFEIDFIQKISDSQKFEGLTLYEITDHSIRFLLCEDNDSVTKSTIIYELELVLN